MTITASSDPIHAPELDAALAWLNVDHPLRMRELRGQVVILDFWTYCCINCMHVVPTLRELEARYRDQPLVVIGVHSGKFSAERDPERIREAVGRYGVEHPIAVDDDMQLWSAYAIRSWPTLVVVRPDGKIAAVAPGEPELETLDAFVKQLMDEAREAGVLAEHPPVLGLNAGVVHEPLSYPGKLEVLPDGRFVVSDSGHHRLLVCERDGEVVLTVGSGLRGHADGAAADAAFDDPQGVCFFEGALYVADTRNHAIRRVDLDSGEVSTVAGDGQLALDLPEAGVHPARETRLRSPWDLCAVGEAIYVAMAGSHQIWRYFPRDDSIEVYAGSGIEALLDGDVKRSAWAQPSGLSERDGLLYVADSETSAIRAIELDNDCVSTLCGQGLFDFGDGEGDADAALLQHCLGVAADVEGILIADTYNGKVKRWIGRDGSSGVIQTVLDELHEPGSVVVAPDGALLVADTNAHRVIEARDGVVRELEIRGAPSPKRGALETKPRGDAPEAGVDGWFTTLLELPEGVGLDIGDGSVSIIMRTRPGRALAPGSPIRVATEVSRRSDLLTLPRSHFSVTSRGRRSQIVPIDVQVMAHDEDSVDAELVATVDFVACHEDDTAACRPGRLHLRVPVRLLLDGGSRQLEFAVDLADSVPDLDGSVPDLEV